MGTTDAAVGLKNELAFMDESGDTKLEWDPNNMEETSAAQAMFDKLRGKGFMAYVMEGENKGRQLLAFERTARRIIMSPAMVGG